MKTVMALILALAAAGPLVSESPDFAAMLKQLDAQSNFLKNDFASVVTMVTEDPEKGVEKTVVRQFRRDREDKFLMLIQEPAVKKGQGYLRAEDNLWFYDPESRKFNHTSMKENFEGSDAKNSDFRMWSYAEDYKVSAFSEGRLGSLDAWVLELDAANDEVTYPFKKIWVAKKNTLLLKTEEYSLTKRLMRTTLFASYAKAGESYVPCKIIFIDNLTEGRKTRIALTEISTNPIPDTVFTKGYVERVSK